MITQPGTRPRRRGERVFAATVALSAYAGAVGLMTGSLDLGSKLSHRLPFHSPVLGGVALALIVALPTTIVAVAGGRDRARPGLAEIVAGVLLVGWILVEIAFIREFSLLQPCFAVIGVAFAVIGLRLRAEVPSRRTAAA